MLAARLAALAAILCLAVLAASPDAAGERYAGHTMTDHGNGTKTYTTVTPAYLPDPAGGYVQYIATEDAAAHYIQTAAGTLSLDKQSCVFTMRDGGGGLLFSDSVVMYENNTRHAIFDDSCSSLWLDSLRSLISLHSNSDAVFQYRYTLQDSGDWKTTMITYNDAAGTVMLPTYHQTILMPGAGVMPIKPDATDADKWDAGHSMARHEIMAGDVAGLHLPGHRYLFDAGLVHITAVRVAGTDGGTRIDIDFEAAAPALAAGQSWTVDPSYSATDNDISAMQTNDSVGTACSSGSTSTSSNKLFLGSSIINSRCRNGWFFVTMPTIPAGESITAISATTTRTDNPTNADTCSLYGNWVTNFTPDTYQNLDQHAPLLSGSFSCQFTSRTYSFTASQIMAFAANVNANDSLGFGLQLNGLRVRDSAGVTMDDFSLSITTTISTQAPGAPTLDIALDWQSGTTYEVTATSTAGTAGSETVTHYDLQCRTNDGNYDSIRSNAAITRTDVHTVTLTGDGTIYGCIWRDRTATTVSPYSAIANDILQAPAAPALSGSATVALTATFTAAAGDPGTAPADTYDLQCRTDSGLSWSDIIDDQAIPASRSVTLSALPAGHYECQWRDRSPVDAGAWSNTASVTVLAFDLPGQPTLVGVAVSDSAIRWTSAAGTAGTNPVTTFSLECSEGGGSYAAAVTDEPLPAGRMYLLESLTPNTTHACRWQDASSDGVSPWSASASATLSSEVQHTARPDNSDPVKRLEAMIDQYGGAYFGMSLFPFAVMLIGCMATPKTVGIFAVITLMIMGILHGSGYYLYPDWYWALMLLFGLPLVLSRRR